MNGWLGGRQYYLVSLERIRCKINVDVVGFFVFEVTSQIEVNRKLLLNVKYKSYFCCVIRWSAQMSITGVASNLVWLALICIDFVTKM